MKRWFGQIEPMEAVAVLVVSLIGAAIIVWNPAFKGLLYWWATGSWG